MSIISKIVRPKIFMPIGTIRQPRNATKVAHFKILRGKL